MLKVSHKKIKIFSKDYESYCFNDFGLYVWRNNDEYFSLRCGPIGQNGIGGHSHYDQLSIESYSNSRCITRDPGTGTYTDDINIRNKFRSLEYHWGPKANIKIPTHPNNAEMGSRVIDLGNPIVYIEREDLQHSALRLKEFGDFDIDGKPAPSGV